MNRFRKIYWALLAVFMLWQGSVSGQISQGGTPVFIQKLKSVSPSDLVILPAVDNNALRKENDSNTNGTILKPMRFAHPFDLKLNPKNSGTWYTDGELNIWQLRIRSAGAYSLNVIFNQFQLPEGSRLFLISNSGEIKGAYTSQNNSESRVLAVEPLAGDELTIQYEEPIQVAFPGEFEISRVSHDFVGIKAFDPRKPMGILSGSCNVNVNCDLANGYEDLRDAVCRILIQGAELCTGTLINNTALNKTPYLLTAYHCIGTEPKASTAVFLFNFESPSCSFVPGDVSRSLSGSALKAAFDSLDFALVQLNNEVPYSYRPYFAGWNRRNVAPSSSFTIHHPQGDVKKISIDRDAAITSKFSSSYLAKGFWNIVRWDNGVTENGSSGGPLFDQNKLVIGTLTGGAASCQQPTNDYFEKFALAWDYRKETSKQLKHWLDPVQTNTETLGGLKPEDGKTLCIPVTNFKDSDTPAAVQITNGITKKGYFSGSNLAGFTDFAEQYKFSKNCEVLGVTMGFAKIKTNPAYSQALINIEVYQGTTQPTTLLYSEKFDVKKMWSEGMNYFPFKTPVKTNGQFFISYNIRDLHEGDTIAVYMANRKSDFTNSFYLKNQSGWITYNSENLNGYGSALLLELIACNVDSPSGINDVDNELVEARFFPNPMKNTEILTVKTKVKIDCPEEVIVYDLLGKPQNIACIQNAPNELVLNFSGQRPGIYFVHVETGGKKVVGKIAFVP
jgi:hypothetical protein